MEKMPESLTVARFQDCDPFGHLNNARYIDYILNAREDHLKAHYGFIIYAHTKETNQGWVVNNTQISYLRPIAALEEFVIRTALLRFDATTLLLEAAMLDQGSRKLKALCWMQFTYVSLTTGRPVEHGTDLSQLFAGLALGEETTVGGFMARVEALRKPLVSSPV